MSDVNDPIYCFNDTECTYDKSGKCYNRTLGVCEFEWLKVILKAKTDASIAPTRAASPFRRVEPRAEVKKEDSTPYSAITKDSKSVKASGKIESIVEKEVNVKGTLTKILKVTLVSGREKLIVTFWKPDEVPDIQEGMDVEITGLMGNDPYNGIAQASGGKFTKIQVK